MNEKLYTKAEAIVKIQSGEWRRAVDINGAFIDVYHWNVVLLELGKPPTTNIGVFTQNGLPLWKEHKVKVHFDEMKEVES